MLADNFPAKAYLLITHLSDTDPLVSSFSSDGTSFEIYDQSIFAQKYLPQYFKHSNYGSFVRQLNLYGFTSSRLKRNNDVVVWTHEFFHRDRKELVKGIKRAKKTKSTKPSHVHVNPRSPSPPSLSDDVSSTDNTTKPANISRKSSIDQSWLESEFSCLKQQNKFLEQKLDTLLQITLRISPMTIFEEGQVGEKRLRMIPVESRGPAPHELGSIYEEQKLFDGDSHGNWDNYGNEPRDYYGIEPAPYKGDRKIPPIAAAASNHELGARDDSLKRFFVDIMLNEEEEEEGKSGEMYGPEINSSSKLHAVSPATTMAGSERKPPERVSDDTTLDDELMEEAMNALHPGDTTIDTDGDLFALSDDAEESAEQLQSNDHPTEYMENRAMDKGPHLIPTISSEVPTATVDGDIEEGNLPVGVAVIAAHGELVEEDRDGNGNSNDEASRLELERHRRHERRDRRRAIYLLAFIGVVLVVVGVTLPAVIVTNNKRANAVSKKGHGKGSHSSSDDHFVPGGGHGSSSPGDRPNGSGLEPCPGGIRNGKNGGCRTSASEDNSGWDDDDRVDKLENSTEEIDEDQSDSLGNPTQEWRSFVHPHPLPNEGSVRHHARSKNIKHLFDDVSDGSSSSISVKIGETDFVCNPNL